jgi:hypothetical protein
MFTRNAATPRKIEGGMLAMAVSCLSSSET